MSGTTLLAPAYRRRRRRRGIARVPLWRSPLRVGGGAVLWALVLFNVVIFAWLTLSSVKDTRHIFGSPWALPTSLHPENYSSAWTSAELGRAALNSVLLVAGSVVVLVVLAAPAAYALSRFGGRGSAALIVYFALGMGIPGQSVVIPLFVAMARLNLTDSLTGLGMLYVATNLPFTVFLLTGFFRGLPGELEEAAALDGAGPLRTFASVMLPLARPGIVTAVILNVIAMWNETFLALVFINDNEKYTLSLGVLSMYGTMQYTSNWGGLFAGVCIVVLPMLLLYVFLGRRIVQGMTLGAGR